MRSHRPAKRNAADQFFRLSSSYQHRLIFPMLRIYRIMRCRGRTEFENVNQPMRRERSIVKFERKPSQRYGPRQSHVLRMRNEQQSQMLNNQSQNKTLNDTTQILEDSNVLFNDSSVSQLNSSFNDLNKTNSSTIAAK